MLAAQAPWLGPGASSGYHLLSYGHLIGEVIRRITRRRPGEFFDEQVAGPLEADFHIGLPASELHRVTDLVSWPPQPVDLTGLDPNGPAYRTLTGPPPDRNIELSRTDRWRSADIGACNGHGKARSVARIQSAVSCDGEVDGVRLLSPGTIERIFEVQSDGVDLLLGMRLRIGLGYSLPWPDVLPVVPIGRVCFGSGAGGSLVLADADRRMCFAYVMNRMVPHPIVTPIAAALLERVYDTLGR
jgi:CubicO group peptidase (beta-lactamase class C family)